VSVHSEYYFCQAYEVIDNLHGIEAVRHKLFLGVPISNSENHHPSRALTSTNIDIALDIPRSNEGLRVLHLRARTAPSAAS
jgi:hypothetical protein